MRRTPIIAVLCALACAIVAQPALAKNTQELGRPHGEFPFPEPDCPGEDCQAAAQLTGFQVQLGDAHNPFRARRSGYVTAFTLRLPKPTADQVAYFKQTYGDVPKVRLSLLHSLHHASEYKLLKQTQAFEVEPYFGSTVTIALRQAFRVKKEDIVGLTVPTWLPAFAHGQPSDVAWRTSHAEDECTAALPPNAAQEEEGTKKAYECFYRGARLLYSATFVGDPKVTNVATKR
jgi:hypothetical protein